MADEEDRLGAGAQRRLEPLLARHVEVVVRLVEQEDVSIRPQQHLDGEPLLLAARQRGQRTVAGNGDRLAHGDGAARVPQDLGIPATGITPGRVGTSESHARAIAGLRLRGRLGAGQLGGGSLQAARREVEQHVADGATLLPPTHELTHDAQPAVDVHAALIRGLIAGDDPEQRGLADAVGTHERDVLAVADAEADVAQELHTARCATRHPVHVDRAHEATLPTGPSGHARVCRRPAPAVLGAAPVRGAATMRRRGARPASSVAVTVSVSAHNRYAVVRGHRFWRGVSCRICVRWQPVCGCERTQKSEGVPKDVAATEDLLPPPRRRIVAGLDLGRPAIGWFGRATSLRSLPMRAVVQRVTRASVTVAGEVVGAIAGGLCVLVGVTHDDDVTTAQKLADKVWNLRILDDADGVMNVSASDASAPRARGQPVHALRRHDEGAATVLAGGGAARAGRAARRGGRCPPPRARCDRGHRPVPHGHGRRARERRAGHPHRGDMTIRSGRDRTGNPSPARLVRRRQARHLRALDRGRGAGLRARSRSRPSTWPPVAVAGRRRCAARPYVEWYQNSIVHRGQPGRAPPRRALRRPPVRRLRGAVPGRSRRLAARAVGRPVRGGRRPLRGARHQAPRRRAAVAERRPRTRTRSTGRPSATSSATWPSAVRAREHAVRHLLLRRARLDLRRPAR